MDTLGNITGLFETTISVDVPDSDGDIRIEINADLNDHSAEIYIPRNDIDDLIAVLTKARDMGAPPAPGTDLEVVEAEVVESVTRFDPVITRPWLDGVQAVYLFDNGYGASVIRHSGSYGGRDGLWEIAVLARGGRGSGLLNTGYDVTYSSPITDDVIGHLSDQDRDDTLARIANLPHL